MKSFFEFLHSLCQKHPSQKPHDPGHSKPSSKMDMQKSNTDQNDVALSLAMHVLTTNTNSVLSPLSIYTVLSLIAAGSNGPTLDQLLSFLKSKNCDSLNSFAAELVSVVFADGSASGGPKLACANGVWVDKSMTLKESFKHVVENVYKASSELVDFQYKAVEVTSLVNAWAAKETRGLIKQILPAGSVDSNTRLVLANALYFKGVWAERFSVSATQDYDFHLLNNGRVKVPFMTSTSKQYISTFDEFKVLRLPYTQASDNRSFSMYIFLPDAKDGLPGLMQKVGSGTDFINRHIPRMRIAVGDFRIPKFKISYGLEASNVLKRLGLVLPFEGGGLTEMVDYPVGRNLCVSKIFHKAFVEVNEEGTEAAAATAGMIMLKSSDPVYEECNFVADHPFLFLIREDTSRVVLFIGCFHNPLIS